MDYFDTYDYYLQVEDYAVFYDTDIDDSLTENDDNQEG